MAQDEQMGGTHPPAGGSGSLVPTILGLVAWMIQRQATPSLKPLELNPWSPARQPNPKNGPS